MARQESGLLCLMGVTLLLFSTLMYGTEDRVDAERTVRELNGEEQAY